MLVEVGAHPDVEGLRHVDLDTLDVLAIPGVAEQPVGEAQHVDVLRPLLAEKVVDPVDLILVEDLVGGEVELLERLLGGAEGLLVDDTRALGQVMGPDALRQSPEGRGWYSEVVDVLRVAAQLGLDLVQDLEERAGIVGVESPAGETQPRAKLLPRAVLRLGPELLEALADALGEVLVGHVPAPVADDAVVGRHQLLLCQPEERRDHQAVGQVPRRAVKNEYRRLGMKLLRGVAVGHELPRR